MNLEFQTDIHMDILGIFFDVNRNLNLIYLG